MRRAVMGGTFVVLLTCLIAALAGSLSANAQSTQSTPTPEQVNAVAKELWCPLCNGVRLDNCDLQACVQMRDMISQKLAAGESKDQIKAYFVQQYGEVVMGTPKSPLPYILPPVIGLLALGWVAYLVLAWVRRRPAPSTASARSRVTTAAGSAGPSTDDYMERVDEELKKYE